MRVLRVTVNNLASLSGEHTVDFTKEPLRSAGLFSISGPTGAGKSTLLDALCLALYDQTPRLDGIGRSNELPDGASQSDTRTLLRRGAGYGMAEVAFIGLDAEEWTARWEVRRSRSQSDGKLQAVDMTLYRGHIAPGSQGFVEQGGRKTLVQEAIRSKIGLTFEQFTRAVLLAQNDFAAFLKATDKERAEILQALTGTQHYEAISRAVYERCQSEVQSVTTARQIFESSSALSVDERADAEAASSQASTNVLNLSNDLEKHLAHGKWFDLLKTLEVERDEAQKNLKRASVAYDESEKLVRELESTELVKSQAGELRSEQKHALDGVHRAGQQLQQARDHLHTIELTFLTAKDKRDKTQHALQTAREESSQLRRQIQEARDLDSKLIPLKSQADAAEASSAELIRQAASAVERFDAKANEKVATEEQIALLEMDYSSVRVYQPFTAEGKLWAERIGKATQIQTFVVGLGQDLAKATEAVEAARTRTALRRTESAEALKTLAFAGDQLKLAQNAVAQIDISQLEVERSKYGNDLRILSQWKTQFVEFCGLRDMVVELTAKCASLNEAQAEDIDRHLAISNEELPRAETAWSTAITQFERMQKALDNVALRFRKSLTSGEPCPVCGALDHPYTRDDPGYEMVALKAAEEHVKELGARVESLRSQKAGLKAACDLRAVSAQNQADELAKLQLRVTNFPFDSLDHAVIANLQGIAFEQRLAVADETQAEISQRVEDISSKLKAYQSSAAALEKSRGNVDVQREVFNRSTHEVANTEEKERTCAQWVQTTTSEIKKANDELERIDNELREIWSAWPTARDEYRASPDAFGQNFTERVNTCIRVQQELDLLRTNLRIVETELTASREHLDRSTTSKEQAVENARKAFEDVQAVLSARSSLLGGKEASAVEKEIELKLQSAEQFCEDAVRDYVECDKALSVAKERLADSGKVFATDSGELTSANEQMDNWIELFCERKGIRITLEEIDLRLGRDQDWLDNERSEIERLKQDVQKAQGAFGVHNAQVEQHRAECPTDQAFEEVLKAIEELQTQLAQARSTSELALDRLKQDDALRKAKAEQLLRLEQLESQAIPWRQLNELIGSADGAKFRMIAQRRTLDVLLGYSNQQLGQLSARYRLERLQESLNLVVIDCEMGEEVRSVHSLSGGESFLVSLSLALGLASLTSERVRVESLFIDEGFGSLDPDTLNVAMGALMQLESQGRKVGVISHVQEMTDAIPVQIRVQKGRGGASRIVIPGSPCLGDAEDRGGLCRVDSPAGESVGENLIGAVAVRMKAVLQRETAAGRAKVSTRALRDELGCSPSEFKAAQLALGSQVLQEGRSLQLRGERN